MKKIGLISVSPRDTAETSYYKVKGDSTLWAWDGALVALVKKGIRYEEAPAYLRECWELATENQREKVAPLRLPQLSDSTRELFSAFRWYARKDGTRSEYVRTCMETQTYVLTQDPLTSATAIVLYTEKDGTPVTLETKMQELYLELAEANQLSMIDTRETNKDGTEKAPEDRKVPSLPEYWDMIKKIWERDSFFSLTSQPTEISTDPEIPCFFYWNPKRVHKGGHPNWDMWMEAFPLCTRKVFRAWIASVVDPLNRGRQAMWIQDSGYSGKSSVIRALTRFLGESAVGSIGQDSLANQFGYSTIFGKRLVVYSDNKNPKLIHVPKVHSVLGGDVVPIERKGINTFTAEIYCRLLIASNCEPEINLSERSEITRILYAPMEEPPAHVLKRFCKVDSQGNVLRQRDGTPKYLGGNLDSLLFMELPAFLYTCQADYKELCPNHSDIEVPEEMYDLLLQRCASPEYLRMERFVRDELVFGEKERCEPTDMMDILHAGSKGRGTTFDYQRLRTFLISKKGVKDMQIDGKRMLSGVGFKAVTGGLKL